MSVGDEETRYNLLASKSAVKQLSKLTLSIRERINRRIENLALDPRPPGSTMLEGTKEAVYRIRVGSYRVLYQVDDAEPTVTILRVGHRRDIYDRDY